MVNGQFENLTASALYCPQCKEARPVYEKLLLVLPGREINGYFCRACGTSLGEREISSKQAQNESDSGFILP